MWASIILAFLKLANVLAGYADDRQLLDAGAKSQIGDEMIVMNERINVGLKIRREPRTPDDDIDELRRAEGR